MFYLQHCPLRRVWTYAGHSSGLLGISLYRVLHSLKGHRHARQTSKDSEAVWSADTPLHFVWPDLLIFLRIVQSRKANTWPDFHLKFIVLSQGFLDGVP